MTETIAVTVTDETSGREITGWVTEVGDDVVVAVGGGDRAHVGCVVLAVPHQSRERVDRWSAACSVLTIPPHKEEPIARGIAERLARVLGRVTVVTAGVHEPELSRAGIATYLALGDRLGDELVRRLSSRDASTV
jgi:hypothetical protein